MISHREQFEKALNSEQMAAVTAPDGPILVLAAAGTGKTRTLVYRVAHLVFSGIPPEAILLLTFTNKAAREMLERATQLVGSGVGSMWGGTFHHMANRILRRHSSLLGYHSDFTILDSDDSLSLVKKVVKEMKVDSELMPKAEVLLATYSQAANTGKSIREVAAVRFQDMLDVNLDILCAVGARYGESKFKMGAMDFDDLLVNGLKLFREHPDVLRHYQTRFRHVLVDEFQDTNAIQSEWVHKISAQHRNLLVVGDDFQSIYSWRGADYRNIMNFRDQYPDARIFKLETNYRSTPEILNVANACIAGNPEQYQKTLRSTREPHLLPVSARLRDGEAQARYISEQVRRLQRAGYRPDEMCVLYRAHYHAMELQLCLTRERMPFVITSGIRFFEQAHIKDVCALLRLLQNPRDVLSFARLLEMLPGVGPKTVQKIWEKLGLSFVPQDAIQLKMAGDLLPAAAKEGWKGIARAYERGCMGAGLTPADLIMEFLECFYQAHLTVTFENAESRLEDIQEMARFTSKYASLEAFLSEVALMTNLDAEQEAAAENHTALKLSTVHQAKGLEWKVVFILWATDGMFPQIRALNENAEGEAEERRLFYVAVTRAKDELYLCQPEIRRGRDGTITFCRPSRFVVEIPQGLLREVRLPYI
jgi:DNA helicase-2/ATP-dependent DNA helicase PcrA